MCPKRVFLTPLHIFYAIFGFLLPVEELILGFYFGLSSPESCFEEVKRSVVVEMSPY